MFTKKSRLFISMLLLFTMVIPNQPMVFAADVPYLEANFNNYSGGTPKANDDGSFSLFGLVENVNYAIGEQADGKADKSIKLVTKPNEDEEGKKISLSKSYSSKPITKKVVLETNIRLTDTEHERSIYEMKSTENGSAWTTILKLTTDGKIKVDGSLDIDSYEADTWYHIKAIMDNDNKTLDVYINGELKADKFSLSDNWSSITSIKFSQTGVDGKTGGMYIDDILIKDYIAPIAVSGVTLQKNAHTMGISDTFQLIPTILPDTATNKEVTWQSSNTAVATVDGGMVTGIAEGSVDITVATTDGGYTATCTVTVDKATAPEILPNGSFEITEDNDHWLDKKGPTGWSVYPSTDVPELTIDNSDAKDGGQSIKVHTDSNKRTDINYNVLVDAGYKYLVTTWIKTKDITNSAYLRVQVTNNGSKVDNLSQNSTKLNGTHDNWTKVELEVYVPTKANGIKVEHMFDTGTGTAWFDHSNIEKLPSVAVESIALDVAQKDVEVGKTIHLTKTITPADATNQEVQWQSSDSNIATVDEYGIVTAIQEGVATITATTKGSGKSASCLVTVKKGEPLGPVNLLKNNGFEVTEANAKWTNNIGPIIWGVWMPKGDTPLTVDTVEKKEGNQSVRIDIPTPAKKRVAIGQTVTVEGGKKYNFGAWIKTDNVESKAGVYVRTQFLKDGTKLSVNGNGPSTEPLASEIDSTKTHNWTQKQMDIRVPAEANQLKVEMFFEEGTGIAWFDDVTLVEQGKYMTDFKLDQDFAIIDNNETVTLNPIFTPTDVADKTITWTTSDENIATVSNGVVKAHATNKGLATITAVTKDGNMQAQCRIFVGKEGKFNVSNIKGITDEDSVLQGKIEPSNAEGLTFAYQLLESPANGIAYVQDTGDYFYYPNKNYNGNDQFSIIVTDNEGGSKVVAAQVTVNPVNDSPIYQINWFTTSKNNPVSGVIEASDVDEDERTYTVKANPAHGNVTMESNGKFTYTPQQDYVGYDYFETSISDSNGGDSQHKIRVFIQPSKEEMYNTLVNHSPNNQHPRLLVTKEKINQIKANIDKDDYIQKVYNSMKDRVDANLVMEPTPYNKKSTGTTRGKVIDAAIMYQITKDPKYAKFVWKELESVANYPEWGLSNSMLGAAEMTFSVAVGYDMIYDYLNDEQKLKIKNAIRDKALKEFLKVKYGERDNNINYVINGNMGLGALAILEDEQETAGIVVEKTLKDIQLALQYYSDDGAWPEGPLYWAYGGQYLTYYTAALNNALGVDYGISQLEGFKNSGSFPVYLEGENGTFNFADGGGSGGARPESMWFASHYNQPEYAWTISDFYTRKDVRIGLSLLFYEKGLLDKKPSSLDKTYKVVEASTFRSAWADTNATFVAMKGYDSQMRSHADLDSGTFIYDALGIRWAMDLGTDNYSLPGFWDNKYQRWTYYRKKPEGHNTLIINPSENPVLQQDPEAASRIINTESKPKGAYTILDMSEAYAKDVVYAKRGLKLFNNRSQVLIQDEVKLRKPSELYWFMHTKANIDIIENGKAALLTQDGKKLYVKLISNNQGATFKEMDAAPLPTSPNPYPDMQKSNVGIKKLALHMNNVIEETIAIWMVPLLDIESIPSSCPTVTPLSQWAIPDGEIIIPQLKGITVDGKPIDSFQPSSRVFNIDLPFGTKEVPVIQAISDHNVTIKQAETVPGIATIMVEDINGHRVNYYVEFGLLPLIGRPNNAEKYSIPGASVTASSHDGNVPSNTVDGDMLTRWSAQGKQWIQYDLGEQKQVQYLSIAFFSGEHRQTIFDVEVSSDGTNWTKLLSKNQSSGLTGDMETFEITPISTKFIRLMGYGNTSNDWNSIKEVEIYGPAKKFNGGSNNSSSDTGNSSSNDSATNETNNSQDTTPNKHHILKKVKIKKEINKDGKKVLTATINEDEVNQLLINNKKTQVFMELANQDTSVTDVKVPIKAIKKMAEKETELVLKTKNVQLTIPTKIIKLSHIAEKFNNSEQDIDLSIQIEVVHEKEAEKTNSELYGPDNNIKPVTKVLSFRIVAVTKDETVVIDDFGSVQVEGQFPFTEEEVKDIEDLTKMNVYKFNEEKGEWEPRRSKVDVDHNIVHFYTNNFSDYTIIENDVIFKDIENHWAQKNIEFLASKHIVNGKSELTFDPEADITKAELIQLMVNALGLKATNQEKNFSDVLEDDWYYEAIMAATEKGLIDENNDHLLNPNDNITKEEMVLIMMRVYNYITGEDFNQMTSEKTAFNDSHQISPWAKQAVSIAFDKGLISGDAKNNFEPQGTLTRAEAVDIIYTLLNQTKYY